MRVIRHIGLIAVAIVLSGCLMLNFNEAEVDMPNHPEEIDQAIVKLEDLGAAPEMTNETWLNTPEPLRLADLRGKVVLLEFWTFG